MNYAYNDNADTVGNWSNMGDRGVRVRGEAEARDAGIRHLKQHRLPPEHGHGTKLAESVARADGVARV